MENQNNQSSQENWNLIVAKSYRDYNPKGRSYNHLGTYKLDIPLNLPLLAAISSDLLRCSWGPGGFRRNRRRRGLDLRHSLETLDHNLYKHNENNHPAHLL